MIVAAVLKDYGVSTDIACSFFFFLLSSVPQDRFLSVTVATDFSHCGCVNPVIGYCSVYGKDDCVPAVLVD